MMRMSVVIVISLFVSLCCIGCTKSGAPSCSNDTVVKLAIDGARKIIRDSTMEHELKKYPLLAGNSYDSIKKLADNISNNPNVSKDSRAGLLKIIDDVDKDTASMNLSLKNFRLNEKNNEAKKTSCSADLVANGNTLTVDYVAQLSDEGKAYVEVQSLH